MAYETAVVSGRAEKCEGGCGGTEGRKTIVIQYVQTVEFRSCDFTSCYAASYGSAFDVWPSTTAWSASFLTVVGVSGGTTGAAVGSVSGLGPRVSCCNFIQKSVAALPHLENLTSN
jgi:hypothetical protein